MGRYSPRLTETDIKVSILLLILTIGAISFYGLGVVVGLLGARQLEWWIETITWGTYGLGMIPITWIYWNIIERRNRLERQVQAQQEWEEREPRLENNINSALHFYYDTVFMIKFIDDLCEHPFQYPFSERITKKWLNKIYQVVMIYPEVQEIWKNRKIEDEIIHIIEMAEILAIEHGMPLSRRCQFLKIGLFSLVPFSFFAILLILFFYFAEFSAFWALLILVIVVVILMQLLSRHLTNRWNKLKEKVGDKLQDLISEAVQQLHHFVQFLIDDLHGVLSENHLDLARYRFILYDPNYEHIKIRKKKREAFIVELLNTS